jgi:hypothetical protein
MDVELNAVCAGPEMALLSEVNPEALAMSMQC